MMKRKIYYFMAFLTCLSACQFSPGSYPYAEKYDIVANENELTKAIASFKELNPQYQVPLNLSLYDGRRNESDHWYHIYFYMNDENRVFKCWLRQKDAETTIFAFIAIYQVKPNGGWEYLNKDFSRKKIRSG